MIQNDSRTVCADAEMGRCGGNSSGEHAYTHAHTRSVTDVVCECVHTCVCIYVCRDQVLTRSIFLDLSSQASCPGEPLSASQIQPPCPLQIYVHSVDLNSFPHAFKATFYLLSHQSTCFKGQNLSNLHFTEPNNTIALQLSFAWLEQSSRVLRAVRECWNATQMSTQLAKTTQRRCYMLEQFSFSQNQRFYCFSNTKS